MMEGKKRRRQSKKSKRSWRKHTDVEDVQEYLEDKQREEIVGVPAAEKTDEQLFSVDNEVTSTDQAKTEETKEHTATVRRRKRPLKTDMYLRPISAVEGFPARKRRAIKKHKKQTKNDDGDGEVMEDSLDGVVMDSSSGEEEYDKETSYTILRRRQLEALRTRTKKNPAKPTHKTVMKDLWANDAQESVEIPDEHYLRVTRKMTIKKPSTLKARPSALENVQVPHPGMSYNPTFEDHQDLLRTALTVEEERERETQKLEKKLQLAELTHQQREEVWLQEMTQGILDGGGEERDDENGEVEGERSIVTKRPVRAEDRKTKKQRRKERERKTEDQLRRFEKLKKSSMEDVFRLRSIKREITEQEKAVNDKVQSREEEEKNSVFQTKRLGKYVYEEPDLELKLSSEIKGSLQSLKPEGNLAMDRYKSLQRRNMIEPRQFVKRHRRYRLKVKSKRSARLPEESQFT